MLHSKMLLHKSKENEGIKSFANDFKLVKVLLQTIF